MNDGVPIGPSWTRRIGPGLLLAATVAFVARLLSPALPSFVAEATVAVLLGLLMANLFPVLHSYRAGIRFAAGVPLRTGIVLLGARLAFDDVVATGLGAILMIAVSLPVALSTVLLVGQHMGLPRRLTMLIAVGTAICGNSAITATAPIIEADERDVSFAIATITLFGTLAVLLYPMVGHAFAMTDTFFGHWVGVAINDTSQVTAAGFAYSPAAGETATIVKLTRNTLLGPVLIAIGLSYAHTVGRSRVNTDSPKGLGGLTRLIPPFVIGFVAMAGLNSLALIPEALIGPLHEASRALILVALAAVGLSTRFTQLREVGARPLVVGFIASGALSVVAAVLGVFIVAGA